MLHCKTVKYITMYTGYNDTSVLQVSVHRYCTTKSRSTLESLLSSQAERIILGLDHRRFTKYKRHFTINRNLGEEKCGYKIELF